MVKAFSDPSTEDKYLKLGFVPDGLSLKLTVGQISVYAVEHSWKGAAITLQSFTPRTMTQYEVSCPTKCSREQIAGAFPTTRSSTFPMSQHSDPEKKQRKSRKKLPM